MEDLYFEISLICFRYFKTYFMCMFLCVYVDVCLRFKFTGVFFYDYVSMYVYVTEHDSAQTVLSIELPFEEYWALNKSKLFVLNRFKLYIYIYI